MFLDQLTKLHKTVAMQSLQIAAVDAFAILSKMGSRAVSLDFRFGGGIVFFKTGRIVAYEIDPGAPTFPSGPNQRPIVA